MSVSVSTVATPAAMPIAERDVLAALHDVVDPELDTSIVELGFVDHVHLDGDAVTVGLRLPTFWCAPNFAYLMAHDLRERVLGLPGVERVQVILRDHFASDEISAGVSAGRSFEEVFPGEAEGSLEELRALFRAKGLLMRQEQLVRLLLQAGLSAAEIAGLRVGDVQARGDDILMVSAGGKRRLLFDTAPLVRTYLDRRRRSGLDVSSTTPLLTDEHGLPLAAEELPEHLSRGRRQRISIMLNTTFCQGMLETRYGEEGSPDVVAPVCTDTADARATAGVGREEDA